MERCLILAGLFLIVLLIAVGCSRSDCDQGYCPAEPECPCSDPCQCGPDCRCCEDTDTTPVPVETGDQPESPAALEPEVTEQPSDPAPV